MQQAQNLMMELLIILVAEQMATVAQFHYLVAHRMVALADIQTQVERATTVYPVEMVKDLVAVEAEGMPTQTAYTPIYLTI